MVRMPPEQIGGEVRTLPYVGQEEKRAYDMAFMQHCKIKKVAVRSYVDVTKH